MTSPSAGAPFARVLVANRGEVAVRIVRTCHRLGMEAVAAVSEADRESLVTELADEVICIGPAPASASYLDRRAIVSAALVTGCDAVHPGYGFLSEDEELARCCAQWGVTFVGPSPEVLGHCGDKVRARAVAEAAGIPVLAGYGPASALKDLARHAAVIGYPVLMKAVHGGGGRGMRLVHDERALFELAPVAASEATATFGNGAIYIERYVSRGRHVEVQVVADSDGHVVHLGDRDCSVQRRHQKLVEEAPAPALPSTMQARVRDAGVAFARQVGYQGIATVEFLIDVEHEDYYFLEVNPRLQVEHGVTELVTGHDLVELQFQVASGAPLDFSQQDVGFWGTAIQARVNAEDPARGFAPAPGVLRRWRLPGGPGIRVDTHCFEGYRVPPYYDSLLAKVMAHAPTRPKAIAALAEALGDFPHDGVATTAALAQRIVTSETFTSASMTTRWLDEALDELVGTPRPHRGRASITR